MEEAAFRYFHALFGCFYTSSQQLKITLTKEFCAQPLSFVWLMFIHKAEVEKEN